MESLQKICIVLDCDAGDTFSLNAIEGKIWIKN